MLVFSIIFQNTHLMDSYLIEFNYSFRLWNALLNKNSI